MNQVMKSLQRGLGAVVAVGAVCGLVACAPSAPPQELPPECTAPAGPGVDLSGCVLTGDLTGVDLTGADLAGAQIIDAILVSADLSGADLRGARFRNVNRGPGADALCPWGDFGWDPWASTCRTDMKLLGADLAGATIEDSNLRGADMTSATVTGAIFDNVTLDQVRFGLANLDRAHFSLSSFNQTGWAGSTARGSSGIGLLGSDMPDDLTGAQFFAGSYVDWTGVRLTDARVSIGPSGRQSFMSSGGGIVGVPAQLTPGYRVIRGYMVGADVHLGAIDLSGVDLRGVNLTQVDLTGANLRGANLSDLVIGGCSGCMFFGQGSSFRDADLTGANLAGAQIEWASFSSANLTDADLTGMDAYGVDFSAATIEGTRLSDAIFHDVDFSGASGTPTGGATSSSTDALTCPDGTRVPAPGTCWIA